MQSRRTRMKTPIEIVCFSLVMCEMFSLASGAVYSTVEIAQKFSYCLIQNMGSSQCFSQEDINDMASIADVLIRTMRDTRSGPRGQFTLKILSIGFLTSISDAVLLEDPRKNFERKLIYTRALEQCSMFSTGYVDPAFIREALRILSTLENQKISAHDSSTFSGGGVEIPLGFRPSPPLGSGHESQMPRVFDSSAVQPSSAQNPLAVQPSSAQNPSAVEFYSAQNPSLPDDFVANEKSISESSTDFASSIGKSKSNINLRTSGQASMNTGSSFSTFNSDRFEVVESSSVVSHAGKSEGSEEIPTDTFRPHPHIQLPNVYEPRVSELSEPLSVQPSPVQSPFIPAGFNANGKTAFEVTKSSSDFASSSSDPKSQLPVRNFDSPDSHRTLESRDSSGHVATPSVLLGVENLPLLENPQPPLPFQGLTIPQTKESTVRVILPKDVPESEGNASSQDEPAPQTEYKSIQPQSDTIDSQESAGGMNPSASSDTDIFNVPMSSTIESLISDILTNSSSFRNAFSLVTTREDAQRLARTITVQSLSEYNSELIGEAMIAVSDAVARVTVNSPESYALALSEALASVLKLHNIPLFVEGASIASSMLTTLDTKQDFNQQISSTEEIRNYTTVGESPYWLEEQQPPLNFQSPVLLPEDVAGEIFSSTLSQYLAGSFKLTKLFCGSSNVTNKIGIYYSLMKSSMAMYGTQISSIAASAISEKLTLLTEESLCSEYSKVISNIISEILYDNGLLKEAIPEEILKQMEFSAGFLQTTLISKEQPEFTSEEVDGTSQESTRVEFDKVIPTLQSFYSDKPETLLDQPSASDLPSADDLSISSASSDDHALIQEQHKKYIVDSVSESSDIYPISLAAEHGPDYESPNYYTIPLTTPSSIEITKEAFNEASLLIDTLTTLPEEYPTHQSLSDNSEFNQEELAAYLLREMESALASLHYSEPATSGSKSATDIATDKRDDQGTIVNRSESVAETATDKHGNPEPTVNRSESFTETTTDKHGNPEPTVNRSENVSETATDKHGNPEPTGNRSESFAETATDKQGNPEPTVNRSESVSETATDKHGNPEPTVNRSESVAETATDKIDQEPLTYNRSESVAETGAVLTDKQAEVVELTTTSQTTSRPRNNRQNRRRKKHKTTTSEVNSEPTPTILTSLDQGANINSETDSSKPIASSDSHYQAEAMSTIDEKHVSTSENKSDTISNVSSVYLQPSFQEPQSSDISPSSEMLPPATYDGEFYDPSLQVATSLSKTASSIIDFIRSENFEVSELCAKLNEFAAVVDIPPNYSCEEIPVIDFLLYVLLSTTRILKGV